MSYACSCISIDIDEGYDEFGEEIRVAGTERTCVECKREIELGEKYEHSWGANLDYDEEVIELDTFVTCLDCTSMRKAFFCDGWYIGRTWDDLGTHLADVVEFGDGVSSDCLRQLTSHARADVCDIIEDIWADQEAG